jgi:outer membrane receptor for ferric coprogen and ferric-rhodotorulic acid
LPEVLHNTVSSAKKMFHVRSRITPASVRVSSLSSAARLGVSTLVLSAILAASGSSTQAQEAAAPKQAVPLPALTVEPAAKKKAKATKPKKKTDTQTSSTSTAPEPSVAPAAKTVRDTSADTEGSNSYTSGSVSVAGKQPLTRREVPQSVSVVTRKQIEDQNMNTVWDALNYVPGVTVVANDPSQQQFHSRGYALNVANDGVPAFSGLSGYQQFDLAIYDRVEVLRGPAGLFVGSGNPSGVVNLVKKRPRAEADYAWAVSYGSWNNKWAELDLTTPLNESKTLRARGVLAGRDKEFFYDRFDEDKWLGYGVVEYDITRNTLLTLSAAKQDYDGPSYTGLPAYTTGDFLDAPRSTNVYPDWNTLKWDTREYTAALEHKFENDWRFKAALTRRDQSFLFNDAYPTTGVNPATDTASYAQRIAFYDYQRDAADIYLDAPIHAFGLKHNFLIGYNYDRFESSNERSATYAVNNVPIFNPNPSLPYPTLPLTLGGVSVTEQSGFYGQARIKLFEPLTLIGGARITDYDAKSNTKTRAVGATSWTQNAWTQGAEAENEITPYGAVILDLTKEISVYGSYTDIFIPQTQAVWPDGTLPPRVGDQKEVGIKGAFFDNTLNASLAYFDIRDTGRAFIDDAHSGGGLTYYLALGEVQSTGIEAEVSGQVLPGLQIAAGYTYLQTEYLKDRTNQGLAISGWYPEHSFKLWAKYDFQDPAWERWSIGAGVLAQSETANAITNAQRIQPAYAVVNTLIGYELDKNLLVTFAVNNVFDESYYVRLGGLNTYNTYGEPRNFMLTLRKSFD